MDAEVIVIGAGPVGGLAARQLARLGLSVLLLEDHRQVGRPVHCAGLIGIEGLHGLGIHPKKSAIINRVRASVLHAPSGVALTVDKGHSHAYVLHRNLLDQQIVHEAESAGAKLLLGNRVTHCQPTQTGVKVTVREAGSTKEYRAHVAVDAEGINARLARQNGLLGPKKSFILPALQYEVSNVSLLADRVHLYFDNRLAPKFFLWVIPLDAHRARVGLASAGRKVRKSLENFLSKTPMLKDAKVDKRYGGLVYSGGPFGKTVAERFIAIGDAAGQTKATSGGGVVYGGRCAIIAAASIRRALRNGRYHHKELANYDKQWKRAYGRQLKQMALLRRLINCLNNTELDKLFLAIQRSSVRELIETKGDIDQQERLITASLTNPFLLAQLMKIFLSKVKFLPQLLWG
ncbi:MAG: geranylgeranyl reductase family protein [Promethearchaeota archaeon]